MDLIFNNYLKDINYWNKPIFDAHIHIWDARFYPLFVKWVEKYYQKFYCLGMFQPKVKIDLQDRGLLENIVPAYYLDVKAFAHFDTKKLLEQLDEAKKHDYPMVKIWFAPRFVDYAEVKENNYRINDPRLDCVYEKIEEYGFKVIIHVADPDLWYYSKYSNERHGTKESRLKDFADVMKRFPKIDFISAHFGSWPENLPYMSEMLDSYPQLYFDTGSTRWMVRELGNGQRAQAIEFIEKYSSRILFGSDLSLIEQAMSPNYWMTRYWSHKAFWETKVTGVELPFIDDDNPFGTIINGLNLQERVLEDIYYKNAFKLFNLK